MPVPGGVSISCGAEREDEKKELDNINESVASLWALVLREAVL